MANQKPPEFLTSETLQPGTIDGCSDKHMTAIGLAVEEGSDTEEASLAPDQKEEVEEKVFKHRSMLDHVPLEKLEVSPPASSQDVHTDDSVSHVQMNEEMPTLIPKQTEKMKLLTNTTSHKENYNTLNTVCPDQKNLEQMYTPTTAEKKVKYTTIVTLQKEKENLEATDQTKEKIVKWVPAEKKSNLRVVVTLQKENTLEDCPIESSPESQQDKSTSSDQGGVSSPVLKPNPLSPSLTYSQSSKQQIQEATVQVSRGQAQYTEEEGGSLSPDLWDDEGPPPPPPPTGKIALHISKTRVRTQSKEEVAGDGTGTSTYLAHDNQGFQDNDDSDKKPIIVFLNEPMDIQSAYKRLSTIFEYEEDLDGILSPESIVDEEETKQEEEDKDGRKMFIIETNSGFSLKDITGNGQNSLYMQHHRPPADNGSIPDKQDEGQPDSLNKTETKRKFKFKFPKTKLAAISQAIRTGTTKTGKKTLEVVVYEEEEEMASDSRPVKDSKKQTTESKRFEINSTKLVDLDKGNVCNRDIQVFSPIDTRHSKSHSRVEELCKSTFDTIDNLEESIKQLEICVDSIAAPSSPSYAASSPPLSPDSSFHSNNSAQLKGKFRRERERSPSKRPAPQIPKGPNPPHSKRAKPQPPHNTMKPSAKKQV